MVVDILDKLVVNERYDCTSIGSCNREEYSPFFATISSAARISYPDPPLVTPYFVIIIGKSRMKSEIRTSQKFIQLLRLQTELIQLLYGFRNLLLSGGVQFQTFLGHRCYGIIWMCQYQNNWFPSIVPFNAKYCLTASFTLIHF